jgi:hypothetical protein
MSHPQRVKDGFGKIPVCYLLILRIRDNAEQYGSSLMMIFEIFLLLISHNTSCYSISFNIHWVNVAIDYKIPEINIITKKETFYYIFSIVKFLAIKDWWFCTVVISFIIVNNVSNVSSDHCFSHKLDGYWTRWSVDKTFITIRTGALMSIESVKTQGIGVWIGF